MNRYATRTILLSGAATCLGLACAADPGDLLKTHNAAGPPPGSSSSSSGGGGSSSGVGSSSNSGGNGSSGGSSGSSSGDNGSSSGGGSSTSSASGSSGGGSSGSGGADAAPDVSPPGPTCITNPKSAAVAYYTEDMAPATSVQTVKFDVEISNAGFSTLNLSDVTVRYWFTADGNALSGIKFDTYYSKNGNLTITTDVHSAFMAAPAANVTPTVDSYLELSFGTASGSLTALGGGGADIQVAFHGPYSPPAPFNETNDYSFDVTKKASTFQPWTNVTAYLKGQLVWGCEPGMGASGSSSSSGGSGSSSSGAGGDGGGSSSSSGAGGDGGGSSSSSGAGSDGGGSSSSSGASDAANGGG